MANEVFKNDTAITLSWNAVTGANLYHVQVSLNIDFSGTPIFENAGLGGSGVGFADSGTDDEKRYWRWRYSTDGGTTWAEWSEVGSYWLDSSATADVSVASNKWKLFAESDVTDQYQLQTFPMFSIIDDALEHIRTRNRKRTLLSEYITAKATIAMAFEDQKFVLHEQLRAFKRFDIEHKTFFIAGYINNGVDNVPMIYKVQFEDSPEFSMLVQTRQDLWEGEITLIEV